MVHSGLHPDLHRPRRSGLGLDQASVPAIRTQHSGEVRFNRAFDILLFVAMVIVIYSGFLVSESMVPSLGFVPTESDFWFAIHDVGGNLLILLVGIHLAMHWPWVKRNISKIRLLRAAQ